MKKISILMSFFTIVALLSLSSCEKVNQDTVSTSKQTVKTEIETTNEVEIIITNISSYPVIQLMVAYGADFGDSQSEYTVLDTIQSSDTLYFNTDNKQDYMFLQVLNRNQEIIVDCGGYSQTESSGYNTLVSKKDKIEIGIKNR